MAEMNPYEFRQTSGGQGQTAGQAPPYERQAVERPVAVTVFGLLNIVVGCWGLYNVVLSLHKIIILYKGHWTIRGTLYVLGPFSISIGFIIWILLLGIGLLTMKRWARRGSIMYARIKIVFAVISTGLFIFSLFRVWSSIPNDRVGPVIFSICKSFIRNFVYPVLLLIFMLSPKVKQAFAAVGG
ncbi:MAG: hypothetical protein JW749_01900 [Sedimentisphaerales bacterium]|nr:hypothetical protein [Sedimentisphaerales bacterium]